MMRRMKYLGPIFLAFFFFVACTPNQPVRPYPAFVVAAIDPGDQVTVVTKDGETLKFIVVRVDENSLSSEDRTIPVADIEQLHKKSKNKPAYPCGKDMPLGCSIPKSIIATENVGAIASSVWGSGEFFKWHTSYAMTFTNLVSSTISAIAMVSRPIATTDRTVMMNFTKTCCRPVML